MCSEHINTFVCIHSSRKLHIIFLFIDRMPSAIVRPCLKLFLFVCTVLFSYNCSAIIPMSASSSSFSLLAVIIREQYLVWDVHLVRGIPVPCSPYFLVPCISRRIGLIGRTIIIIIKMYLNTQPYFYLLCQLTVHIRSSVFGNVSATVHKLSRLKYLTTNLVLMTKCSKQLTTNYINYLT